MEEVSYSESSALEAKVESLSEQMSKLTSLVEQLVGNSKEERGKSEPGLLTPKWLPKSARSR